MTRAMWFGAAVAAALLLFAAFEWLAWQAGRRWYAEPLFPAHACDACEHEEWRAQHAGA